ncbi:hypothetical protein [Bradyrhizobium brasilense]|uniref:hypothetical protein n=1 Tax=Bradyrhizobium brasilense TaxID=1419277 RepID=UPI001E5B0496|nr:hypothetical protein [Bradyrhizobium brasilense]
MTPALVTVIGGPPGNGVIDGLAPLPASRLVPAAIDTLPVSDVCSVSEPLLSKVLAKVPVPA